MRVHSGEKPFVCSQCNYSCNQADRLRIYMRIHSREKIVMSKLLINCLLQMPYRFFFFIFPTYVTTLRTCELVVDDTLDGENNLEKKTREVSEFMVVSHPRWRKFQLNWYTPMSATSLVFFSRFFSPSTAQSTNNTHEQKLGKWDISGRDLKKYANCQITMCLKIQKVDKNGRLWLLSALFVATATHCVWWPE